MPSHRLDRISEEIKRELSELIRGLKDPRLAVMTSVIKVQATKDLRYAKVHVSVLGNQEEKLAAIEALKNAAGYLRRSLNLSLRYTPELIFQLDNSMEHGAHINRILEDLDKQ